MKEGIGVIRVYGTPGTAVFFREGGNFVAVTIAPFPFTPRLRLSSGKLYSIVQMLCVWTIIVDVRVRFPLMTIDPHILPRRTGFDPPRAQEHFFLFGALARAPTQHYMLVHTDYPFLCVPLPARSAATRTLRTA